MIESDKASDLKGQTQEDITLRNRDINNKITLIESLNYKFLIKEDIDFVRKYFNEYRELIDDHIADADYLNHSRKELRRPLDLMKNKLFEMSLKLFE